MDKFVLHVPEWQGELVFSKEVIVFVGVILLLIVGTLFCFWGYKYFRTVLFIGIGTVACYAGYLLIEPMTANSVVRMFLTVSLTFLGVCFVYFLDIIFGYILDRLHIRTALGKRTHLLAAPLGAAILGLTIYYCIWRDEIVAAAIVVVCLVPGLIFQHFKRKKQVRFRTYNDLLRLSGPTADEDGLEYIAMGTTAAATATVASVLTPKLEPETPVVAAPEPESAPEPPIVAAAEPEPAPEPPIVAAAEPEPAPEPPVVAAIEPESAPEPPVVAAMEPTPVPAPVESDSDLLVVQLAPEPRSVPELPTELSDTVKELILRKTESEEDILEEALFVKQINDVKKAEKKLKPVRPAAASGSRKSTASYAGKITVTDKHGRKPRKKRERDLAKGAAIVATGLGIFIAGRVSKGGD